MSIVHSNRLISNTLIVYQLPTQTNVYFVTILAKIKKL